MKMFILIFNTPLCKAQQTLPPSPIYNVDFFLSTFLLIYLEWI